MLKDIKKQQDGGVVAGNDIAKKKLGENFSKTKFGKLANSTGFNMFSGLAGSLSQGFGAGDPTTSALESGFSSALSQAGPVGNMINAGDQILGGLNAVFGANLGQINKSTLNRAGLSGANTASQVLTSLPVIGEMAKWFGSKTDTAYKSSEIDEVSGAYGGSTGDINAAQDLSNQRMLFGKKKANRYINEANRVNNLLTNISLDNKSRKSSTYGENLATQNFNRYSGINNSFTALAKNGMKLPKLEEARKILVSLPKFQEGGKLNVIVEGALHAHKHELTDVNPDLDGVTKKGVPVVAFQEGGELVQSAEVEGGELILTKEITEKLEELYHDGSEEAMIEAGKLLTEEIIEFTDDKTNELLDND